MTPDPQRPAPGEESAKLRWLRGLARALPWLGELLTQSQGRKLWVGRLIDRLLVAFALMQMALLGLKIAGVAPLAQTPWFDVLRPLWEYIPNTISLGMVAMWLIDDFGLN